MSDNTFPHSRKEWATYYFIKAWYHYLTKGDTIYVNGALANALHYVRK